MSKSSRTSKTSGQKPASAGPDRKARRDNDRPDALASALEPLSLWRTLTAHQFVASDVRSMQQTVAKVVPFGVEKWTVAREDVAAAVGAAVAFLPLEELTVPFDLCMTVLAVHAIEGDAAAAMILSRVLRSLPGHYRFHRRIATSWFVANLATAAARGRDAAKLPSGRPAPARKVEKPA
jgi:hypothetical protein